MQYTKDDKWLLASHLQKSIRRGLKDEAQWSAKNLHDVDRSYLAYRMSVIAVEDLGAGDPGQLALFLSDDLPWGARRFFASKTDEDARSWAETAALFSQCTKDRTPCDWMACAWWLKEFEQAEGPWSKLDPQTAIAAAYNEQKPWWWRGLMAWRVAGTDKFPSDHLPQIRGDWGLFIEAAPQQTRKVLTGFGAKQREAHPVFLPLAVYDRIHDQEAKILSYELGPVIKKNEWLVPALDKHTGEGKRMLARWIASKSLDLSLPIIQQGHDPIEVIGRLMFWIEGGRVDRAWTYATQKQMDNDIKKRWLSFIGVSGRWLFDTWGNLDDFNEFRQKFSVIKKPKTSSPT